MKRQTNRTHQNNKPQTGNGETAAPMGDTETAHKVVALRPDKGNRKNIFETDLKDVSQSTGHKLQVQQEARQRLAEAKDLWAMGAERAEEAKEIAAKASLLLSTARIAGELSADEVSGALGDIFGYKPKKDGSPSKTPNGQGEAIRKRIVRLSAASEYLANPTSQDGFFKGCPEDRVRDILNRTVNGDLGFWAAYEEFAALKREQMVSVPLAFNSKRIAEIAETLQKDGAAKAFVNNAALRQAYSALWAIIRVVGEEAAEMANAA